MNLKHIALDDDLGVVRLCYACKEWWPDDEEFYRPGGLLTNSRQVCHACRVSDAERQRRYRERQRNHAQQVSA